MAPFADSLARTLAATERWLLPSACLLCHGVTGGDPGDGLVCPVCRSRWTSLPEPICRRCGQPTFGVEECRICTEWPEGLTTVRSAVWLDGGARQAVHLLKYEGWHRLANAMAGRMRGLIANAPGLLVPVPLAARRLRRRGYNQAAMLARGLSAYLPALRTDPGLLDRCRDTPTQTALAPAARQANLAGAFRARRRCQDQRVILVDDVFTTGATLVTAADALLRAGARVVEAVTFARAKPAGLDGLEPLSPDRS